MDDPGVLPDCINAAASRARAAAAFGDPLLWPQALRLTVDIMLNSPAAMLLMWRGERLLLVNDPCIDLLGAAPLRTPGTPAPWPATGGWNGAALDAAWAGDARVCRRQELPVWRAGTLGMQMLDLFYTPIRDAQAQVDGVLCAMACSGAIAVTAEAPRPPDSLRVLVVEDNPDALYLVCEMLRAFGHQVQAATHGEDAAGMLSKAPFDVLLTDVSLPGMSGIELARGALRERPGLKIIFASGHGDALTRHLDFAAASLQKPYEFEQLEAILNVIGQRLA